MASIHSYHEVLTQRLEGVGQWLAPLGLRLLLAWEFFEAGREKLRGDNWFGDIQSQFPFPFDRVPADLSWSMATWAELIGAVMLALGLGTRFAAFSLFVLTVVATAAVHWPQDWMGVAQLAQGYAITDMGRGNYKLPVIFLVMLLPLVLRGAGRFSLDALFARGRDAAPLSDARGWGLCMVAFGLPLAMLLPLPGLLTAAAGGVLCAYGLRAGRSATLAR